MMLIKFLVHFFYLDLKFFLNHRFSLNMAALCSRAALASARPARFYLFVQEEMQSFEGQRHRWPQIVPPLAALGGTISLANRPSRSKGAPKVPKAMVNISDNFVKKTTFLNENFLCCPFGQPVQGLFVPACFCFCLFVCSLVCFFVALRGLGPLVASSSRIEDLDPSLASLGYEVSMLRSNAAGLLLRSNAVTQQRSNADPKEGWARPGGCRPPAETSKGGVGLRPKRPRARQSRPQKSCHLIWKIKSENCYKWKKKNSFKKILSCGRAFKNMKINVLL